MKQALLKLLIVSFLFSLAWSCKKSDPKPEPDPEPNEPEATVVNKFIYDGLSTYYLWEAKVANLNNEEFNKDKNKLNKFLNGYTDPEKLFNSLLYKKGKIDKWSFIVDQGEDIDDWIAGISETMGFDFQLYYIDDSQTGIMGVIRYVYKDSPAEKAGLKRGDMFYKIDGTQITGNNYKELLFTKKTYTISLAEYDENRQLKESGVEYTMTAIEMQEDPIHLDTILNVGGLKVGYLVYNGFNGSFDKINNSTFNHRLNDVFGKFKNAGVDKFVLDLRYNSGGSILTAMYLASMIYTTDTEKIFATTQYNAFLQKYFSQKYGSDYFNDNFKSKIGKTDEHPVEAAINSLNLNEIYIITTDRTASASELLINGLKPYITVHQVGSHTAGKYVGSFTIKDWLDDGSVNPKNKWAMQPITLKISNSAGVSDYVDGLTPDIEAAEGKSILMPFADLEEPMLKACLNDMGAVAATASTKAAEMIKFDNFKSLRMPQENSPYHNLMYRDDVLMQKFSIKTMQEDLKFMQD